MTGTTTTASSVTLTARGVTGVYDAKTDKWLVTGRGPRRLLSDETFRRLINPPSKGRDARS